MPLRGLLSPDSFGVACQALEAYQEAAVLAYILPSAPSGERLRPSGCAPHAPSFENLTFSFLSLRHSALRQPLTSTVARHHLNCLGDFMCLRVASANPFGGTPHAPSFEYYSYLLAFSK